MNKINFNEFNINLKWKICQCYNFVLVEIGHNILDTPFFFKEKCVLAKFLLNLNYFLIVLL